MSIFDFLKVPDAETQQAQLERQVQSELRRNQIMSALARNRVPDYIRKRLHESRDGKVPWISTLTPAELMIVRSHGVRPIAAVSASCWLHYGFSWTNGHREGWQAALGRLRAEAKEAGANAVLDVKMRTVALDVEDSMDFTLVGTAVKIEGLPAGQEPLIATVPALEFVKLIEMGIVPTGIAIGAQYQWLTGYGNPTSPWSGNTEVTMLSRLLDQVRSEALRQLRRDAEPQGNGCLAHIHFSQMFEGGEDRYLARYIVIATVINQMSGGGLDHEVKMCLDMGSGQKLFGNAARHHQSYQSNESEGAI